MSRGIHPLKRIVWHSKPHEGYADPLYTYGVRKANYPVPAIPLVYQWDYYTGLLLWFGGWQATDDEREDEYWAEWKYQHGIS